MSTTTAVSISSWASGAAPTGVWVWLGGGSGTFGHTPIADSGAFASFNAGVSTNKDNFIVDLNGDGALDFVYVSDGAGGAGAAGVSAYLAVDTDGDGIGDLVDTDDDNDGIAERLRRVSRAGQHRRRPAVVAEGRRRHHRRRVEQLPALGRSVAFARDANVVTGDPQRMDGAVSFNPAVQPRRQRLTSNSARAHS